MAKSFPLMKKLYPQYLCGRDRKGNIISIEKPGKICPKSLKKEGVTKEDVIRHTVFIQEFIWNELQPESGKTLSILDFSDFPLSNLFSPSTVSLTVSSSDVLAKNYPGRIDKVLFVNLPRFASKLLGILKSILPKSISEQIKVCSDLRELQEFVDPEVLPTEYGGSCDIGLSNYEEEQLLCKYAIGDLKT